jgi:hypothetical protein
MIILVQDHGGPVLGKVSHSDNPTYRIRLLIVTPLEESPLHIMLVIIGLTLGSRHR